MMIIVIVIIIIIIITLMIKMIKDFIYKWNISKNSNDDNDDKKITTIKQ